MYLPFLTSYNTIENTNALGSSSFKFVNSEPSPLNTDASTRPKEPVVAEEPLISPEDIKAVIQAAQKEPGIIINAMCPIKNETDFRNPNIPKIVTRMDGRLLYMSRSPIPTNKKLGFQIAMKQVCIMAFPYNSLITYGSVKEKTPLENIEDLELLRLLELGYDIKMIEVSDSSIAVDTPQDLEKVRSIIHDKF